jgi:hypothetical protein
MSISKGPSLNIYKRENLNFSTASNSMPHIFPMIRQLNIRLSLNVETADWFARAGPDVIRSTPPIPESRNETQTVPPNQSSRLDESRPRIHQRSVMRSGRMERSVAHLWLWAVALRNPARWPPAGESRLSSESRLSNPACTAARVLMVLDLPPRRYVQCISIQK